MKFKLLVVILLSSSLFATAAEPLYMDKDKSYTDMDVAFGFNDKPYVEKALKNDIEIIGKINNTRKDEYVGFDLKSKDLIPLLISSDPKILSRISSDNRNIVLGNLVHYYNFAYEVEDQKMFAESAKEIVEKVPEFKNTVKNGSLFKNKDDSEEAIISLLKSGVNINHQDKYGNNALHYAVYYRMDRLVDYIINDKNFYGKNTANIYGELPILMLANLNCNVSNKDIEKTEIKIFNSLYQYNKLAVTKKNKKNVSFASFVFFSDKHNHLKKELVERLGKIEVDKLVGEGAQIKSLKGDTAMSLVSSGFNRNMYNSLSCK